MYGATSGCEAHLLDRIRPFEELLVDGWRDPATAGWTVDGQRVWPLLAHALNTVGLEHLLLGRPSRIASARGRLALATYGVLGEAVLQPRGPRGGRMPGGLWERGDILVVSSAAAIDRPSGRHGLAGPLRDALAARGGRSRLLLIDGGPEYGGDAVGIAADLAAIRRTARPARLDRGLAGYRPLLGRIAPLLGLPAAGLAAWTARLLDHFRAYRQRLAPLLAAGPPGAIVLTDHGDAFAAAVCSVARAEGVPVFCIQHGALRRADPEHPDHPQPGARHETLPGRHLLWRRDRLGPGLAFGPPRLHAFLDMAGNLGGQPERGPGLPVVVAAPQAAGDVAPIAALLRGLGPVLCRWRPHPRLPDATGGPAAEQAVRAAGAAFELDPGPLAASLLAADALVTGYSAAALEAAALGVPTYFLSPYAPWLFAGQIDPMLARFAAAGGPPPPARLETDAAERLARFRDEFGALPGAAADAILRASRTDRTKTP